MPSPSQGGIAGPLPPPSGLGGSLATGGGGLPTAIHFWAMNEGTGSTLHDGIGTTDLTTSNVAWTATPSGMGASADIAFFNGTNSFAQASAVDASLNFSGTTPFTLAFWAYLNSSASATFFGNLTAPTTYEGWEMTNAGGAGLGTLLVNQVTSNQMSAVDSSGAATGTPIFIALTYTGSLTLAGVKEYINGVSQTLTDTTGTLSAGFTSAIPFLVGRRADATNSYNGGLAYLRIWNQVLTPTQISTLFTNGPQ